MSRLHASPSPPLPFIGGAAVGALSWLFASLVSGKFEPYDSTSGLLANQFILSASAALLAWRYQFAVPFLFLIGTYLGMNAYAYALGSSETRAWAALGAVVSALLLPAPMILVLGVTALRHLLHGPRAPEGVEHGSRQE